jgi:hypothetical protein
MTKFASRNLTAGQLNAVVKMIGGEQAVRDCLSGKSELLITQKEATKRLERIGEVVLPAITDPCKPAKFFKTCNGLCAWDSFREWILPATKQVNSVPEATITRHKLVKDADNAEIRAEMPDNHVFEDASSFCAHLAGMIDRQKGGKDGNLSSNGCANIFYVRGAKSEVFAVYVHWIFAYRRWGVGAYALGDDRWRAGGRAVSIAT